MKYAISYEKDGIWHSNIVDAPSGEIAVRWMRFRHPDVVVCDSAVTATRDHMKPGIPVITITEGNWIKTELKENEFYCSVCGVVETGNAEFCPRCNSYMR